ncbi:hypothetical protein DL767_007084 [Monosporascus sp. MG133]|nr:hypothetical protein DL767_007084 [Monosporascus sp. MG133]
MPAEGGKMSSRRGGKAKANAGTNQADRGPSQAIFRYSDRLRRFTFEGMITYGSFGVTWKAKFEPHRGAGGKRTADCGDDALENERHLLRGAVGIVSALLGRQRGPAGRAEDRPAIRARLDKNGVAPFKRASESSSEYEYPQLVLEEPLDDPLSRTFRGVRSHYMIKSNWLYEEYMENGRLIDFAARAKRANINHLPNRVLWSISSAVSLDAVFETHEDMDD